MDGYKRVNKQDGDKKEFALKGSNMGKKKKNTLEAQMNKRINLQSLYGSFRIFLGGMPYPSSLPVFKHYVGDLGHVGIIGPGQLVLYLG